MNLGSKFNLRLLKPSGPCAFFRKLSRGPLKLSHKQLVELRIQLTNRLFVDEAGGFFDFSSRKSVALQMLVFFSPKAF